MKARKIAKAPDVPELPEPDAEAAEPLTGASGPETGAAGALVACRPAAEWIRAPGAAANAWPGATGSPPGSPPFAAPEARVDAIVRRPQGPETDLECAVDVETVRPFVSAP